jgi:hypothetical protein
VAARGGLDIAEGQGTYGESADEEEEDAIFHEILEQLAKTRPDWQEGKPESSEEFRRGGSFQKVLAQLIAAEGAWCRENRLGGFQTENSKREQLKDQGNPKLQGSNIRGGRVFEV